MISLIKNLINNDIELRDSICDIDECIESDKIKYNENDGFFLHIRIDGKLIRSNEIKKADCLIFFTNERVIDKILVFIIETKKRNPSITEVHEQIQNAINKLQGKFNSIYGKIILIPLLYSERISSIDYRIMGSTRVNFRGKKLNLYRLQNGSDLLTILKYFK